MREKSDTTTQNRQFFQNQKYKINKKSNISRDWGTLQTNELSAISTICQNVKKYKHECFDKYLRELNAEPDEDYLLRKATCRYKRPISASDAMIK